MPDFATQLTQINSFREAVRKQDQVLYDLQLKAQRGVQTDPAAVRAARIGLAGAKAKLKAGMETLYQDQTHDTLISNWDADIPMLLLPVRLQTRFVASKAGAGLDLLIRIYPDDIFICSHEDGMTDDEIAAGKTYWNQIRLSEQPGVSKDNQVAQKKEAWRQLCAQFHSGRSLYIARKTTPVNRDKLRALKLEGEMQFNTAPWESGKTKAWTRPAYTQLLPDRFQAIVSAEFVSIIKTGLSIITKEGNVIPDTLHVGPDPLNETGNFNKKNGEIIVGDEIKWMTDFAEAERVGMGIRVPLAQTSPEGIPSQLKSVKSIVVVGAIHSADKATSSAMLQKLLDSQQYTKKGIRFLKRGTPTNNTDEVDSGWSSANDLLGMEFFDGFTNYNDNDNSDGSRLAQAMGLPQNIFKNVPNAGKRDFENAKKMNAALSPATIDYYLGQLMSKVFLSSATVLDFFKKYVVGIGSYPSIAVGNQPYGIALAGNYRKYAAAMADSKYFQQFTNVLSSLDSVWQSMTGFTPRVGTGDDPAQTLTNILSLHATSVEFGQQWFYPETTTNAKVQDIDAKRKANDTMIINYLKTVGYTPPSFPMIFNFNPWFGLLWNHESKATTMLGGENVVKPGPYESKTLLGDEQGFNYLAWLGTEVSSVKDLEVLPRGSRAEASTLLFLMVRHVFLRSFAGAVGEFLRLPVFKTDPAVANQLFGQLFSGALSRTFNIDTPSSTLQLGKITQWEVFSNNNSVLLDGAHAAIGPTLANQFANKPLGDMVLSQTMLTAIVNHFNKTPVDPPVETKQLKEFLAYRKLLGELAALPAATLYQNLASHLDCLSHRLDAWQEGLMARRMEENRAKKPDGIYLGAFGWLENLKPAPNTVQTDGNFMHAPSVDHAAAAAVMKSAFLNHKQPSGQSAFALNLHSERLQRAVEVLDRMRNGERLESILGFQFERELNNISITEKNAPAAAAFIPVFRQLYPIKSASISASSSAQPVIKEVVSSVNCVDGLSLAEEFINSDQLWRGKIRAFLSPSVPSPNPELEKLRTELRAVIGTVEPFLNRAVAQLADTLDAAKDLLTAETTYQMAQGNFSGSGATLEALKQGTVPSQLGFVSPTRQNLMQFDNRFAVHFDTVNIPVNFSSSPRATAEPGMNLWCANILGDPKNIVCSVQKITAGLTGPATSFSLATLSLQPIDFVCLAPKRSELEARIAYAFRKATGLADEVPVQVNLADKLQPTAKTRSIAEVLPVAATLQKIFALSRPLTAMDYLPNGAKEPAALIEIDEYKDRINKTLDNLAAVSTAIKNTPLAPAFSLPNDAGKLAKLSDVFAAMIQKRFDANAATWLQGVLANLTDLQNKLIQVAAFGFSEAFPEKVGGSADASISLVRQAMAVVSLADKTVNDIRNGLTQLPSPTDSLLTHVEALLSIGKQVFNGSMPLLPRFTFSNTDDINNSNSHLNDLLSFPAGGTTKPNLKVEEWLGNVARVRPKLANWETLRFIAARPPAAGPDGKVQTGFQLDATPIQVPFDAMEQKLPDGTKKPIFTWAAIEFAPGVSMRRDLVSIIVHGNAAQQTTQLQTGLLIDEWSEAIPNDEEITAVTFHYNQPNAEAPQTMLLAVCPDAKWTWQTVLESVTETLRRAKLRTVDIARIKSKAIEAGASNDLQAIAQLLPMCVAPVNVQQHTFSLDFGIMNENERKSVTAKTGTALGHYEIWKEQ